jgi:SAM-dependent methyltransferase
MLDRDPCVADVAVTNQALGGDPDVGTPKHLWLMLDGSVPMSLVPEGALCQVAVHLPCGTFRDYTPLLQGMVGLEIGGPSLAVADLGVYTAPARLDNADFSPSTLWSSSVDGAAYECAGKTCPGTTHVVDAVALATKLPLGYYDFVVSSHVLEHLVNPLKALWHMSAVTKAGGFALHVLPWKVATFDHCRRTTPWKELLAHYREDRDETDVGDHLDEVRAHYDLARDPKAGTWDEFLDRCSRHAENRALHVHVFDFELLQTCLEFMGYRVLDLQLVAPLHQVILAQKVRAAPPPT